MNDAAPWRKNLVATSASLPPSPTETAHCYLNVNHTNTFNLQVNLFIYLALLCSEGIISHFQNLLDNGKP